MAEFIRILQIDSASSALAGPRPLTQAELQHCSATGAEVQGGFRPDRKRQHPALVAQAEVAASTFLRRQFRARPAVT